MERHHDLLRLWREQGAAALRIAHLDFHCDMRGMLVDRKTGRAYRIRDRFPDLDQGNFLTHAVLERRVDSICWVHDDPGGRADDIGTVKFESDFSAIPHRIAVTRRNDQGTALDYQVVRSSAWEGLRPGEHLDIDWDYFAALEYDPASIEERIDKFWREHARVVPEVTYICYSPEYSHPSRDRFDRFVEDLATRFDSTVVARRDPAEPESPNRRSVRRFVPRPMYLAMRNTYRRTVKAAKHRGIH